MREDIWLTVRSTPLMRRLGTAPVVGPMLRTASHLWLPSATEKALTVKAGIGEGLTLRLNPRWQHHLWQGSYEPSVQRVVSSYFKPGKTVYDIGGGIGFYSLAAARLGASVFTFEPDPRNIELIEGHARMNRLQHAFTLVPLAVFSRTGTLSMEPSKQGHGQGHAYAAELYSTSDERFSARCTTLDDFALEHPAPDFIKIDVEGSEAEVVRGAERLMREARPAILCETHSGKLADDVERLIRSRGYRMTWLENEDYCVQWAYATAG